MVVKEVTDISGREEFVRFPFSLFKDNDYWVPPLVSEEMEVFNRDENPVFGHADARLFMAYRDGKAVGRVAAIINRLEVERQGKPKIRFGWFDVIDDLEVSRALIGEVEKIGRENGLEYIEGPLGFSNMDKAGMLVEGFDKKNTMVTWYSMPYYHKHMEQLGFEKATEWVEYRINIPKEGPNEKVRKFSDLVMNRYNLQVINFSSNKEILDNADRMFELINKTYSELSTYVPVQSEQVEYYKKKYLRYLHPDFITCVGDEQGELVAFAITMPSFAEALQKAKGSLLPFGWLHMLKARWFPTTAAFYLIGVKPELQNKGVTAIIFKEMNEMFNRKGIEEVETNPELEDNKAIQALWGSYEHERHKRRRTYGKAL